MLSFVNALSLPFYHLLYHILKIMSSILPKNLDKTLVLWYNESGLKDLNNIPFTFIFTLNEREE